VYSVQIENQAIQKNNHRIQDTLMTNLFATIKVVLLRGLLGGFGGIWLDGTAVEKLDGLSPMLSDLDGNVVPDTLGDDEGLLLFDAFASLGGLVFSAKVN